MKTCTRCQIQKQDEDFRKRHEKRKGKGDFYYLNNTCRKCDTELSQAYYKKVKDIEEVKQSWRERGKKYRKENRDVDLERQKIRRGSESYKENRKRYIQKNKEKIRDQEKICKDRWHQKNRDGLSDIYVVGLLVQKSPLARNEIPPSLIKLKRLQIICKRTLKLK